MCDVCVEEEVTCEEEVERRKLQTSAHFGDEQKKNGVATALM
jgi:hypothetical protein